MSLPRRLATRCSLVALCVLVGATQARAEDLSPVDPWPLPGAAPKAGAAEARSTLDALDARRHALVRTRLAPLLDPVVLTTPIEPQASQMGRSAVTPAQSMRGLRYAARRSQEADARTVPEVMSVLAATAFDGGIVAPDLRVLPGPDGKVTRIPLGRLHPTSIDDRPYVLRPSLLLRPSAVPPPPPPRTTSEPSANRIVKGVRIEVDEALLRRAFAAPGAPPESAELAALETRLLAAADGDAAAALLLDFGRARKQALLEARTTGAAATLTRVSLRALLEGAGPTTTCGGLTRIVGVAVDAAGGTGGPGGASDDVTLLGLREPGQPAIPLEALALALRCVWREGRVPGCSLDPDPKNPAGAQHVRVFGVPPDSAFAKVMLEADYAMKRVIGRAPGAPTIADLVDLPTALAQTGPPPEGHVSNRYWLTPAPPGPGDVLLSADGAAALFDARVTVRTEEMREDFAVGRGRSSPASALVARSFTERYDDVARALPIFSDLRGLFDAVYAAQVLRFLAPRHPLLERAADRPHAPTAVPSTYAGIRVVHQVQGTPVTLEGGCEAATRLAAGALLDVRHPTFVALATARGETLPPMQRLVAAGRDPATDDLLLAAQTALAEKRYDEATDLATEALERSPDDLSALSLRGVARVRAQRLAGMLDAYEAALRAPHEPLYEANLRALLAEAGDERAYEGISAPAAEVLHATYLAEAATAGLRREWPEAALAADRALRVLPTSADARVLRATLVWLSGDLVAARQLADETAALLPQSADAQGVAGWVAGMAGDLVAARAAFDRGIAIRPAADLLGSRAVLRLISNDIGGAGADVLAAIALDAADWGTQQALVALRRAACLGVKGAQAELAAQLQLPVQAQFAFYEAQQAVALEQHEAAVSAYERGLEALASPSIPPEILAASHAREMGVLMLAQSLSKLAAGDPSVHERVEALLADVETSHPDWVAPRWLRVTMAQKAGDIDAALAALATCHGADPSGDPVLLQYVPPSKVCFAALVSLLEATLPLMSPGGPRPPSSDVLERLRAAYRESPSLQAAEALCDVFEMIGQSEDSPESKRATAHMAEAVTAIAKDGSRTLAPEEVLVRVALLGGRVGELSQKKGAAQHELAEVVRAVSALTLVPDVYESLTTMVAEQRKGAFLTALGRFVREVEADPRGRFALRLAESDLEAARRMIEAVVKPARDRAASLGEPLLEHLVDLALMGMYDGIEIGALDARLTRVRRVLEVALAPEKIARLRATEAEILARKATLEEALGARASERTARLRQSLSTPTDARTQLLLQREMDSSAVRHGRAAAVADPLDQRRQAEISLAASLRALHVPLPEGLK